ncbi:hypothetical protein ACOTVM_04390 [Aliarcobacter butzleri]
MNYKTWLMKKDLISLKIMQIEVDDRELNYDPWKFFSPEDIEQGHEKRLRWGTIIN